jgi:hypothetical protein
VLCRRPRDHEILGARSQDSEAHARRCSSWFLFGLACCPLGARIMSENIRMCPTGHRRRIQPCGHLRRR